MNTPKPQALLFDLGGVLIDIDFSRAFRAWQPISHLSVDEIAQAFKFDAQYEKHERGEITASEYFDHLCSILFLEEDHTQKTTPASPRVGTPSTSKRFRKR